MRVQQTQSICITFVQRRPNVFDVGPTLYKYYKNILCFLGAIFCKAKKLYLVTLRISPIVCEQVNTEQVSPPVS